MTSRRISDATMAVRDAIYEGLLVRKGSELTESVARERANNICIAVIDALSDLAVREAATDEPPPVRETREETAEEHARRVIK